MVLDRICMEFDEAERISLWLIWCDPMMREYLFSSLRLLLIRGVVLDRTCMECDQAERISGSSLGS